MTNLCGLYTTNNVAIPLEGTHVEARIVDMIAEVNVLQFYVNYEPNPIEATYVFPLDSNAAVCDFQYEINGKIVQGQVKEKEAAKKEYREAISRGDGAALLQQEKADIFQISVGNIPSSTRVNVKITYVVEMDNEEDFVRFLLPTTIAPRYVPYTSSSYAYTKWIPYYKPWNHLWCDCFHWDRYHPYFTTRPLRRQVIHHHQIDAHPSGDTEAMRIVNSQGDPPLPFALSLYLRVEMPSSIVEVVSPTHDIQTTKESEKVSSIMFVRDSEALDKDVIIKIKTSSPHIPRAILETSPSELGIGAGDKSGNAVMLTLVPQFLLNDIQAEFIFIVDRSGSMAGTKMTQTSSALLLFLRSLPANSYFNIIGFGSNYRSLFKTSQPYEEVHLEKALKHVKKLSANLGGTELLAPLRSVYNQRGEPGYSRQIFVLTDGEVSNTEEVVRLVQESHRKNKDWRLFTIGVGSSVSHALVEGMARGGKGTCQIIKDNERIEPKVMGQLKQSLQPALTNIRVDWGANPVNPTPIPASSRPTTPSAGFATMAPKIGSLLGHRVNQNAPEASLAARNDLVYQAPFVLPPVFSNKRFICYAYLHPSVNVTQITLTADSPDGPLNVTLPIEQTSGLTIHRLAARGLIRDLEEGSSHLHFGTVRASEEKVKKEIIDLGLKFNLSSKHTSFVAIEDRSAERAENDWLFTQSADQSYSSHVVNSLSSSSVNPKNKRKRAMAKKRKVSHSCSDEDEDDDGCMMETLMIPSPCTEARMSSSFYTSSSSSSVAVSSTKSPRDTLNALLDLQKLNGSFEVTSTLASLLCLPLSELQTLPAGLPSISIDFKLWATALVIGYLEKSLQTLKQEWELVAEKSKKWIDGELKKTGVESSQLNANLLVQKAVEKLTTTTPVAQ
jgi:hypothetical protein